MRIWSLHSKYLDTKGLIALWRETLLAKKVIEGKTKGYKHHPQLNRFYDTDNPLSYINSYLNNVYLEAKKRGYCFDQHKIDTTIIHNKLLVSNGQLEYEKQHLLAKLKIRDMKKYQELVDLKEVETHPLFYTQEGNVEDWEKIK